MLKKKRTVQGLQSIFKSFFNLDDLFGLSAESKIIGGLMFKNFANSIQYNHITFVFSFYIKYLGRFTINNKLHTTIHVFIFFKRSSIISIVVECGLSDILIYYNSYQIFLFSIHIFLAR